MEIHPAWWVHWEVKYERVVYLRPLPPAFVLKGISCARRHEIRTWVLSAATYIQFAATDIPLESTNPAATDVYLVSRNPVRQCAEAVDQEPEGTC